MKYILILTALFLASCATTQNVMSVPLADNFHAKSAYFVPHNGKSGDMDGYIQRELIAHNIAMQTGPDVRQLDKVDMIVKYNDSWAWDLAMYLKTLDIQFFDAKSGNLLAQGHWENSAFHKFPDAGKIVNGVMNEMFTKVKVSKN
jgi:hypothetical protein